MNGKDININEIQFKVSNYQEIIDNKTPEKPGEFSGFKQQHDKKEKKGGYSAMLKAFKGD